MDLGLGSTWMVLGEWYRGHSFVFMFYFLDNCRGGQCPLPKESMITKKAQLWKQTRITKKEQTNPKKTHPNAWQVQSSQHNVLEPEFRLSKDPRGASSGQNKWPWSTGWTLHRASGNAPLHPLQSQTSRSTQDTLSAHPVRTRIDQVNHAHHCHGCDMHQCWLGVLWALWTLLVGTGTTIPWEAHSQTTPQNTYTNHTLLLAHA